VFRRLEDDAAKSI
jgi:hypothetical protein